MTVKFLIAALAVGVSAAVQAQVWSEQGDAGDTPATAQQVIGNGPLTAITGHIDCCHAEVDTFAFLITSPFLAIGEVRVDGYIHNFRLFLNEGSQTPLPSQSPVFSFSGTGTYRMSIVPDALEWTGSGWAGSYSGAPFDYVIHLNGAEYIPVSPPPVPEPPAIGLLVVGLATLKRALASRR